MISSNPVYQRTDAAVIIIQLINAIDGFMISIFYIISTTQNDMLFQLSIFSYSNYLLNSFNLVNVCTVFYITFTDKQFLIQKTLIAKKLYEFISIVYLSLYFELLIMLVSE